MAVKLSILSDFAIQALKANKMRSFLTMLGIIIGVGAVVLMMAIGQGEQQQVDGQPQQAGHQPAHGDAQLPAGRGAHHHHQHPDPRGCRMPSPICPEWRQWPRRCGRAAW